MTLFVELCMLPAGKVCGVKNTLNMLYHVVRLCCSSLCAVVGLSTLGFVN